MQEHYIPDEADFENLPTWAHAAFAIFCANTIVDCYFRISRRIDDLHRSAVILALRLATEAAVSGNIRDRGEAIKTIEATTEASEALPKTPSLSIVRPNHEILEAAMYAADAAGYALDTALESVSLQPWRSVRQAIKTAECYQGVADWWPHLRQFPQRYLAFLRDQGDHAYAPSDMKSRRSIIQHDVGVPPFSDWPQPSREEREKVRDAALALLMQRQIELRREE